MPDTPNLGITHLASAQSQPEVPINDALNALDSNLTEILDVDCSAGGTISVSEGNFQAQITLRLTGSPAGSFTLQLPSVRRLFLAWNQSGQSATVQQTGSPGDTESLADGDAALFIANGGGDNDVKRIS